MHAGFAFAMVGFLALTSWWARESMTATAINRRLMGAVLFLFVVQGVMALGNAIADRSPETLLVWNLVLYAAIAGMLTMSIEAWLWPAVVAYLASFVLASYDERFVSYATAFDNALITVIAVWRWRPASLRYSQEERAANAAARSRERR
jgi:serine/threonine-protein kinase